MNSAEVLNEFYTTIASKLVNKLPDIENEPLIGNLVSTLKLDLAVSLNMIEKILKEFSPLKSLGCLMISSRLYLDAFDVLTETLAFIMNLSLRTKVFPSIWKRSIVTPIPKKGNRCVVENTRLISLIHLAGKILEKIVNEHILAYLRNNHLLSNLQFGFTRGKSTTDCIMALCQELLTNINNDMYTCCVFLDYAKAFDSVNHSILVNKLKLYGIVDFEWF